jgi:CelD/BcsL family acetyltransferase involved in cellulose biosynthesis
MVRIAMQPQRENSLAASGREAASGSIAENRTVHCPGHLSLVTNIAALEQLTAAWRELHSACAHKHGVFQSADWCLTWAHIYATPELGIEPCVVTGYQDGNLVFLWPLMKVKQGPLTILRWLTEPFAQYGDVVVKAGSDALPWCRSAMEFLRRLKGIDCLRLRHVREDAAIYPFLQENFNCAGEADEAPYLDLTAYPTEAEYDKRYSREQRKRRGKIRKSLAAMGTVDFQMLPPGSLMDRAMEQAVTHKRQWLDERGLYSKPLQCPYLGPFLRELSRSANGSVALVTSCLKAGDRPISWEIGLRFGKSHFWFITAHDTSLTDASPARLHMDMSQRQAIKDGMRIFDLMVPGDPHKQSWSNGSTVVHNFHAPLSLAGRLYGFGYLSLLRPIVRRFYFSAPAAIRSRFTRLFTA